MRDPRLVEFAKKMRREMTEPEKKLWYQLRAKRLHDTKFRRQNIVGRYIADFYSRDARLIIEIDGDSHAFRQEYDLIRKEYMEDKGFRVLRFTNSEVINNLDGVLIEIGTILTSPLPSPLRGSSSSDQFPGRSCPRHDLWKSGGLPTPESEPNSPEGERVLGAKPSLSPLQGREARLGSSLPSRSREGPSQ